MLISNDHIESQLAFTDFMGLNTSLDNFSLERSRSARAGFDRSRRNYDAEWTNKTSNYLYYLIYSKWKFNY